MRRVKTPKSSNTSPLAMFSAGVEQIISERMSQASKYDDRELVALQRSHKKPAQKVFLFNLLAQQLFWRSTEFRDLKFPSPLKALVTTPLKIMMLLSSILYLAAQAVYRLMGEQS